VKSQINPFQQTFNYNWQLLNPAGLDRAFILNDQFQQLITAGHQQQWIGVEGAPISTFLSYENRPGKGRYFLNNKIKWGLATMADKTDALSQVGFWSNFSYYLNVGKGQTLHLGLQAGLKNNFVNGDDLRHLEPETLDFNNLNFLYFDTGMGAFYKYKRLFFAGFSIPQFFGINTARNSNSGYEKIKLPIYNYVIGGFLNASPRIRIEPSLQMIGRSFQNYEPADNFSRYLFRGNVRNYFIEKNNSQEIFWIGAGYATIGLLNLEAGVNIATKKVSNYFEQSSPNLRLGFNYQVATGKNFANLGTGISIEISLLFP
jgi:type IX secretion system PorP/SprF family membrane protein